MRESLRDDCVLRPACWVPLAVVPCPIMLFCIAEGVLEGASPSAMCCKDRRLSPVLLLVLPPNGTAFRLPLARRLDVDCLGDVPMEDDRGGLPGGPKEPVRERLRFISGLGLRRRALAYPLAARRLPKQSRSAATRVDDATASPTTAARAAPPGTAG